MWGVWGDGERFANGAQIVDLNKFVGANGRSPLRFLQGKKSADRCLRSIPQEKLTAEVLL
ncbi:MAG: hypothetical protein F6K17_18260 [Okeania sp. SIO3C4]|nr:hypothetical protein [Okeania sp. SIO3B3]NER04411.1 hypothetical protein [Okeania sp. SIO3C4]